MAGTTNGTQLAMDLSEVRANINTAIEQKRGMASELIARGASGISTESTIGEIGDAAVALVDSLERGEQTSVIVFHINPTGSEYYVPADANALAQCLNGAHVLVEEVNTTNVWRIPINSLENVKVSMDNTFTKPSTTLLCSIVCGTSSYDIRGRRTSAVVTRGANTTITLTTYLSDEDAFEVGRVFPVDANDKASYLITATTANGVRTELFGQFDADGNWVSDCNLNAAVPQIDPSTGDITWANGAAPVETVKDENGVDTGVTLVNEGGTYNWLPGVKTFERDVFPWNLVKRETFTLYNAAKTTTYPFEMSGFRRDAFYGVKVETRTMTFNKMDGTSVQKECRILWVARPHLPGYHTPSNFYEKRWVTNDAGGLSLEMELADCLFMGAHKGNAISINTGSANEGVLNTGTIGSVNSGGSVVDFVSRCANLNKLPMRDPADLADADADGTGRRWAADNLDTNMAFWPLFVVQFGIDAQKVFMGAVTDSGVAQIKAGETDVLIESGFMTGCVGLASGYTPFVFLGIENFMYGSEGSTLADVSYFSGRDTDTEEDGTTATPFETKIYVQVDRSRYTPNNNSIEQIVANGYQLLTTRDSGNSITHLCARTDSPSMQDMHMPTRADDGFLNAKGCDTGGHGIYRSGQATGNWVLSNATMFGYRNGGGAGGSRAGVCALGWCGSGAAPGYSVGDNFGSRVTLLRAGGR